MDCFVPRSDAKRQRGRSQEIGQRKVFCVGKPNLVRDGRVGHGRRAGKRPKGMAKCLTLTERRLSFGFTETTPRPEGQALRQPRGGPIEAALNFSLTFLSREKEEKEF